MDLSSDNANRIMFEYNPNIELERRVYDELPVNEKIYFLNNFYTNYLPLY